MSSPQVDEFIIRSTSGRVSHENALKLTCLQIDKFIIKSKRGQVRPFGVCENY